jgi:hypothetical protein
MKLVIKVKSVKTSKIIVGTKVQAKWTFPDNDKKWGTFGTVIKIDPNKSYSFKVDINGHYFYFSEIEITSLDFQYKTLEIPKSCYYALLEAGILNNDNSEIVSKTFKVGDFKVGDKVKAHTNDYWNNKTGKVVSLNNGFNKTKTIEIELTSTRWHIHFSPDELELL